MSLVQYCDVMSGSSVNANAVKAGKFHVDKELGMHVKCGCLLK